MKIILLSVNSANEPWHQMAVDLYVKKINPMVPFEVNNLKKSGASREQAHKKKIEESEKLLESIKPDDYVILFDERGKSLSSEDFSKKFEHILGSGKKRCLLICGGAYGVSEEVQKRADLKLALAPFVMNHLVAQVVILEQVFRAMTIIKGTPYHNM